jgi:parallel beta-helix repeat protein
LKHCRIRRLGEPTHSITTASDDADTVLHCVLQGHTVSFESNSSGVFQYNIAEGYGSGLHVSFQPIAPLVGNHVSMLWVGWSSFTEIYNNEAVWIDINNTICNCHDNQLDRLHISESIFDVERNTLGYLDINESAGTAQLNELGYIMIFSSSNVTIQKNLIVAGTGIFLEGTCNVVIQQNTFIFNDNGIQSYSGLGTNQVINNIFLGDGVNSIGVYRWSNGNLFLIRYNDFYNVTETTHGCQLGLGNILLDPCFRAGNPYDYQLQANSPCIDTGDPSSPLDPDGTRADMGCNFFDHRIDNPPAIISPVVVNVQRGTTLRYIAKATDDFGPLNFGFWNLPPWLYRVPELMDFMQKYAVVQGRVPQGQGNFTFGIWVQDGFAQRDSQVVSVLVSPYTILGGELTGILTREQSPYLAVDNLVIPEQDSLIIEPGVEIRFQWDSSLDCRKCITVQGKLNAVGTESDSIKFIPEHIDPLHGGWRGVWCFNPLDTTHLSYVSFINPTYGIYADSGSMVEVLHSKLDNACFAAAYILGDSHLRVDSCDFLNTYSDCLCFLNVDSSSGTITDSYFQFPDTVQTTFFNFIQRATGYISGCTFSGGGVALFDMYSRGDFIKNRSRFTNNGIDYVNGSSGIFANNICNLAYGLLVVTTDSVLVANNVFSYQIQGIYIEYTEDNVVIKNNTFFANSTGVYQHNVAPFHQLSYNNFFANNIDYVNCSLDSTNIFANPIFQDTINFRLSIGSPCIDAGDPDPFFNDVDSSRNDIGCWGGPWGQSYPYPTLFAKQPKPLPTEFALLPPYPNPFNSVLVIPFTLPFQREVIITIYNILGQKVQEFTFPSLSPGAHRVVWNSGPCASGLYIIRLMTENKEFKQKVILLK